MRTWLELEDCLRPSVRVESHERRVLSEGWEAACSAPVEPGAPSPEPGSLAWLPARVPGTAAGALRDTGRFRAGDDHDFDAEDWWFRTTFETRAPAAGERLVLALDGIATVAEVHLNGAPLLTSDSMFVRHRLDVGSLVGGSNELLIHCRALAPLLRGPRRPRSRWRTRLVRDGNLRFLRTMLLGRAPGFAPGPAAVGPWREVWLERRRDLELEDLQVQARLRGSDGELSLRARLRALGGFEPRSAHAELSGPTGAATIELSLGGDGGGGEEMLGVQGTMNVADAAPWWPHTHGEPSLYSLRLRIEGPGRAVQIDAGRIGFRSLSAGASPEHELERDGLQLHVNGVSVFARGAVWTPLDLVGLAPSPTELRRALEQARDAGMNLLRIPGTAAYEQELFYELCDELGLMVWQDFMFANLDYPIADERFRAGVEREARQVLGDLAAHPSLVVLCGNSEIEQQVAMLGLDPGLGRGELFGELLPRLAAASGTDAVYIPSAPCGGEMPFRPERGVTNYYGVGGYRRPLQDARRAGVRFAAECLAFSNVPDSEAIAEMLPDAPGDVVVHHPRWKAGVPRDAGSGWDFEDVRDHYLAEVFGVEAAQLRRFDHERYLELSRALTGEVMAEVLGEWRREGSPCGGALVLWLRDLLPGAGWGVIDHRGEPKVAYHHMRRALAPIAVWMVDEGLGGVRVHAANDRPQPLRARLRLAFYRDFEQLVGEARETIQMDAHSTRTWDAEALLGHFVDASWAYRFGPPAQDLIVASLEGEAREDLLSQAVFFPAGRPLQPEPASGLGLCASAAPDGGGARRVSVSSARFAYGVRFSAPGFIAREDAFCVEPSATRVVELLPRSPEATFAGAWLTALNLRGRVVVAEAPAAPSGEPALAIAAAVAEAQP